MVAAVVVTVTTAVVVETVPVVFTEAGENAQVASDGKPAQAKVIVPLNPVELDMFSEVEPAPPGVFMMTAGCPAIAT